MPIGPAFRMSLAKIGSSAVAPPSRTAKRSSEIVPRIAGRERMKLMPANTLPMLMGVFATTRVASRIEITLKAASANSSAVAMNGTRSPRP